MAKDLVRPLGRGHRRRKLHKTPGARTPMFINEMTPLTRRPEEIQARLIPDDWEGDLITENHNQSAVATLVERKTRYVIVGHLPDSHDAEVEKERLTKALGDLPQYLRRSLTWDQGAKMAGHRAFFVATNMDVYFCDCGPP
ncbi:IS30 family transposase [Kocuria sp. cx-455]|uniref:IS30 family transposase n=1 Tax=Kocuria sp. cx-455 TaxID=2771377 RepID=UPI003FA5BF29